MAFVKHPDTAALEAVLRNLNVGEIITWDKLSASIGVSCAPGGPAYPRLRSAVNSLLGDSIVIGTVKGEGLQRLDDAAITENGAKDVKAVRRKAGRALRKLASVREFDKMTESQKRDHLTASAQLGAIRQFSTHHATKKISAVVSDRPLALGATLELFGHKGKAASGNREQDAATN